MREWFEDLAPREQLFVGVGAIAVAVIVLYALVWAPFNRGHNSLEQEASNWQRALVELGPLKNQLANPQNPDGGAVVQAGNQTPVVIVDQTSRTRGLDRALKRSQPVSNSGIRVEFENVAFDDLVLWLGDLSTQYGLVVQQGSFSTAQGTPGRVNSTLTLERSP